MADKSERQSFNFSSMDWDAYIRFRPIYPEELYAAIYAYHDSHGGAYDSAVDVGAGVGIVSAELIKKFAHVTVTDPSEAYVSQAKAHFTTSSHGSLSFLQTKAEDLTLDKLSNGEKVDMVTAAECLHWADLDVAVPKIASVLNPGGTFAAWIYGVRPILAEQSGNLAEAKKIFYEIYEKMIHHYDAQIEKQDESTGGAAMNARLDHMSFPSNAWVDVRRTYAQKDSSMVFAGWPSKASKVLQEEKVDRFQNQEILHHEADYDYLEGYLRNWIPPIKVKEFAKTELAQLKEAMGKDKIDVTWPFVLVLASRK